MPYGKAYCPNCTAQIEKQREQERAARKAKAARRYDHRRDQKYIKFYHSKPWKLLSAKRLEVDKFCAFCGKPAVEVDHIVEIQTEEGWARRLDWNNTRSLCHKCHDKRHKRFQKRQKKTG